MTGARREPGGAIPGSAGSADLAPEDTDRLTDLAPLLRKAVALDPRTVVRLRLVGRAASALVRLPFRVLVARTVEVAPRDRSVDVTVRAAEALDWLAGVGDVPVARDTEWRAGLPPATGWRRIESVPDDAVRGLVRSGAQALKDAAEREGVPGAQPRAEVTDALLDSTVLTVDDDQGGRADVTLRTLSAIVRMGFLPRGGQVHVDTIGRWIRVVAEYGTVYLERPGAGLHLR